MADKISTATAYSASAGASFAGWITLNDLALWVGIICAITTAVVNYWFKREHLRLAKARTFYDGPDE